MPDDDGIRSALADSSEWAEHHAHLPGPLRARRRARTRSTAVVTGAAVLSALAVSATVLGVSRIGPDSADPPVAAATSSGTGSPTGVPTTIPADFDLRMRVPFGSDFVARAVPELPDDICPATAAPDLGTATDRRFQQVTGPEYNEVLGLAVFADADAAMAFMTGLQTAATTCAAGIPRAEGGTREAVQEPLIGPWASGLTTLMLDVPTPGGDPQPVVGSKLYAARVGSAVALQYTAGENLFFDRPYTIDPVVVAAERAPLDALAPHMCRWTVAGC